MKHPFLLKEEVVEEIYKEYTSLDIPSLTIPIKPLYEIIQESFWASLTKEEDRNHLFSISIISPDNFNEHNLVYFFKKPIGLNKLPKLSPALETTGYRLGVWIDNNEKPYIWGFGNFPLACLRVEAFKTAQIVVTFPDKFHYLINNNKASFASLFYTWFSVFSPFMVNLPKELKNEDEKEREVRKRYYSIAKVVNSMRRHSHGGILLIVPKNGTWKSSIKDEIPFEPKISYQTFCEEFINLNKNLKLLSQLTAVDGATIINFDFEILAFGAKIKANGIPERIYRSEPFEEETANKYVELSELGGTRHQSVVQFIFEQKDAFGIVVSQDGNVSIVFWQECDNHLEIIQHAELWFSIHEV